MVRLFFVHVLGIRPECVGWARGAANKRIRRSCTDGCAANEGLDSVLGPVLAAFGPIEAQGRGSIHPHILIWLVAMTIDAALDILLKDRGAFKERLRQWMHESVRAVVSVQETSVQ